MRTLREGGSNLTVHDSNCTRAASEIEDNATILTAAFLASG